MVQVGVVADDLVGLDFGEKGGFVSMAVLFSSRLASG